MLDNSRYLKLIDAATIENRVSLPKVSGYNVCNPSVLYRDGKFLAIYKGINFDLQRDGYKGQYAGFDVPFSDSQNYYAELDKDLKVLSTGFIEDRHLRSDPRAWQGIQDLRVFLLDGKICCMGTAISHAPDIAKNKEVRVERVVLCELDGHSLQHLTYLPSRKRREKNWMPWIVDNKLYCIYNQDPFEVLQIKDGDIQGSLFPRGGPELVGHSGGSCVIPWKDKYISIIHRRHEGKITDEFNKKNRTIRSFLKSCKHNFSSKILNRLLPSQTTDYLCFTHAVVVYSKDFDVLFVSAPFTFEGERVEFCNGLQHVDSSIIISYGVWDKEAILLRVKASSFFESIGLGVLN